jgi:pullulanase/glycogen debranching enzyme
MATLAQAFPLLGQGIPFVHAGCEILRTKSLDADSYDSGDWFNRVDWTLSTNHHGMGLPGAEKNRDRWNVIRPLLARRDLAPGSADIRASAERVQALLAIRRSSPLFRLRDADEVQARVRFPGNGPGADPGVIVMALSDAVEGRADLDPLWERIVVVFNAHPGEVAVPDQGVARFAWSLHPALAHGADEVVKRARADRERAAFVVPGLSVAVFVSE